MAHRRGGIDVPRYIIFYILVERRMLSAHKPHRTMSKHNHGRHASFISLYPGGVLPNRRVAFERRNRPSYRPCKGLVPAMGALKPGKTESAEPGWWKQWPNARRSWLRGNMFSRPRVNIMDARRRFGLTGTDLCRDAKSLRARCPCSITLLSFRLPVQECRTERRWTRASTRADLGRASQPSKSPRGDRFVYLV